MNITKGTKLIAIDPCEMEYEDYGTSANEKALIVGKEYKGENLQGTDLIELIKNLK